MKLTKFSYDLIASLTRKVYNLRYSNASLKKYARQKNYGWKPSKLSG